MYAFLIVVTILMPTLRPTKEIGPPQRFVFHAYNNLQYSQDACHRLAEIRAEQITEQVKSRMPFAVSRVEYSCSLIETRPT